MAISKLILNGEVQMDVTSDTVTAGSMLSGTTATKNDGTKATGTIATKSSTDLTVSGATVTAPAGYYSANASKSVATMTLPTTTSTSATSGYTSKATLDRSTSDRYLNIAPGYNSAGGYYKINKVANGSVTAPSSISGTSATVSTGTNTLTLTKSVSVTPNVTTAGYISSGTAGNASVSLTASVTTKAAATITPSTSEQSIAAGTYLTGKQTISAMPSGTAGTPTASKGSVSNHAISVTPSVTNTTGYITGGTKTGTAVSVSASELVSGTKSISANGTGIDVTNYASVDVAVPSVSPTLITKNITENGTYNASSDNADGYSSVTVNVSGGGTSWQTLYDGSVQVYSSSPNYFQISPYTTAFQAGQTYRVTWGQTQYICTTIADSLSATHDGWLIGNLSIVGAGTDTGEPFIIYRNSATELTGGTNQSTGTVSLKIELQQESGGGSSYTPISVGTIEVTANVTSTSAVELTTATIDASALSSSKMIYVKIRDKAGKRNGYFWGTDTFFLNWRSSDGTTYYNPVKWVYGINSSGTLVTYVAAGSAQYGVHVAGIGGDGHVNIKGRYNSSYTGTIDGTYSIDIYMLQWPDNVSPLD